MLLPNIVPREAVFSRTVRGTVRRHRTAGRSYGGWAHSFRDLLQVLGTLARNQVTTAAAPDLPIITYAQPTKLQQDAFDLMEITAKL